MTNKQVGEWIKARRDAQKLQLKALAEAAGISRQAWYELEAGKHSPSTDTQAGIARAYGLRVDWYDRLVAGEQPVEVDVSQPGEVARMEERLRSEYRAGDAAVNDRVEGLERALNARLEGMVAQLEVLAVRLEQSRRESEG